MAHVRIVGMNFDSGLKHIFVACVVVFLAPVTAYAANAISACADDYNECLQQWKNSRVAFLKSDAGYLNLAGLFWLREGRNTFGGGNAFDLAFPVQDGERLGAFELRDNQVFLSIDPGHDVRVDDASISGKILEDDSDGDPDVVSYRNLSWSVIRRDDKFAVRLRNSANPALSNFPPLNYFPTALDLRIPAALVRYAKPRVVRVDTVIDGLDYNPTSPGTVRFEIDGAPFELEVYSAGDELFIVFGDQTSGRETYPAGRFLYTQLPDAEGNLSLDFNTAHNPPCAFNEFATCPVASPRNRLPVAINAGERFARSDH